MSEQPSIRDQAIDLFEDSLEKSRRLGIVATPVILANELLASPMIRCIQAEAWDEGFDAHDQDWKHHDANNWGNEDCIDATYNPYRDEDPNV